MSTSLPLPLPESRAEIARIQSERKRMAFELAKTVPWYRDRLEHDRRDRLDDPREWEKIPILDKDILRKLDPRRVAASSSARFRTPTSPNSGVRAARPASRCSTRARPRTLRFAELSWGRSFPCMGIGPGDLCHISFPIGVHPAGQVWARSAQMFGVGMVWVGAGNAYPSGGAARADPDAAPDRVHRHEQLCAASRQSGGSERHRSRRLVGAQARLLGGDAVGRPSARSSRRMWGAEVYDVFGMSEAGLMGAENAAHDGIHIWTDMYFIEVVDPETGHAVPDGEIGTLVRHAAVDQSRHAVPALEFRRPGQLRSQSAGTAASMPSCFP